MTEERERLAAAVLLVVLFAGMLWVGLSNKDQPSMHDEPPFLNYGGSAADYAREIRGLPPDTKFKVVDERGRVTEALDW